MKKYTGWFGVIVSACVLYGCAGGQEKAKAPEPVVAPPLEAEAILTCYADQPKMTRKEFGKAYRAAAKRYSTEATVENARSLICLSLHPYATTKQLTDGIEQISLHAKQHPESNDGLRGLKKMMERINKERSTRWALSTRTAEKKANFADENRSLQEQNAQLLQAAEQDQEKIIELQLQIEQLKNIENIIKSREH
ncbi:MAG: hypothetical protein ACOX5Z_05930 [Desulfobulbus sp.]|jgi:uncharacterized protein YbaP (TraB family)